MNQKMNLLKDNPKRLFFKYLIPSICATLVTSIYIIADTIIVGKGIGPMAVAALNIVIPIYSILFGTGLLFGVGGSVMMGVFKGSGDEEKAHAYFSTAFIATAVMALLYYIIGFTCLDKIAVLLGGTEQTMDFVLGYAKIVVAGTGFFMFSSFLQTFIRNDQAPKLSMYAVITGGVLNIVFDYLFVYIFHWGMQGAALATVLGTVVTCCILSTHFFSKQNTLKLSISLVRLSMIVQIVKSGLSSFIVELSTGIVIYFFNIQLLAYIGEVGVTAYGIISNLVIVVMSLCNGISQAAQPIITVNFGAGNYDRVRVVRRLGIIISCCLGVVVTLIGILFPNLIMEIFIVPTDEIIAIAPLAIRLYFISFLAGPFNVFMGNYFQARVMPYHALLVTMLRGLILAVLFVYLLPALFGATGIWLTMPVVDGITLLVTAIMAKREKQ